MRHVLGSRICLVLQGPSTSQSGLPRNRRSSPRQSITQQANAPNTVVLSPNSLRPLYLSDGVSSSIRNVEQTRIEIYSCPPDYLSLPPPGCPSLTPVIHAAHTNFPPKSRTQPTYVQPLNGQTWGCVLVFWRPTKLTRDSQASSLTTFTANRLVITQAIYFPAQITMSKSTDRPCLWNLTPSASGVSMPRSGENS